MSSPQSTLDTLLLGIPIVAMMVIGFFRLDELVAKPRTRTTSGHPLSHRDKNGHFVCIEPDGRHRSAVSGEPGLEVSGRAPGRVPGKNLPIRQSGKVPLRSGAKAVQRISVIWHVGDGD